MNLTIKTSDLKTALQPCKKVQNSKISNFILSGIKLTADHDTQTLTIEGTDLELALKTVLKAEVTSSGSVVVPYKNLDNLANVCKDENITLNLIETKRMVKSSRDIKTGYYLQIDDKEPQIIQAENEEEAKQIAIKNHLIEIDKDNYRFNKMTKREEFEEEVIDQTLQIYKLKLNTFMVEEFPIFPELNPEGLKMSNNLNFNDFKSSISKVIDFASKDQSRVILTGLLLDTKNNVVVATDSYKLATQSFDFKEDMEEKLEIKEENPFKTFNVYCGNYRSFVILADNEKQAKERFCKDQPSGFMENDITEIVLREKAEPELKKIILPSRIYELLKMIKGSEFNIAIDKDNSQISFEFDNVTVVSRLLSGKFPDYEKLIPEEQNFNYCFKINSEQVIGVLDEANKLLNLNAKDPIPIKIAVENNNFKFSAKVREVGNYESTLEIENLKEAPKETFFIVLDKDNNEIKKFETNDEAEDFCATNPDIEQELYPLKVIEKEIELSEPLTFAVNPDYLKICLKNLIEPILSIVEPLKPMVLQETDDFKVLLMPIRIS